MMIENFIKLLNGISSADDGVEMFLSPMAFEGLAGLTNSIYGDDIENFIRGSFERKEDGSYVCVYEDLGNRLPLMVAD